MIRKQIFHTSRVPRFLQISKIDPEKIVHTCRLPRFLKVSKIDPKKQFTLLGVELGTRNREVAYEGSALATATKS